MKCAKTFVGYGDQRDEYPALIASITDLQVASILVISPVVEELVRRCELRALRASDDNERRRAVNSK